MGGTSKVGDTVVLRPPEGTLTIEPLDVGVDHVRGPAFPLTEIHPHALAVALAAEGRDALLERACRDVRSAIVSGDVHGTPTLFVDGVVHTGGYDAIALLEAAGEMNVTWTHTYAITLTELPFSCRASVEERG